jgi:drug/metabolite transporter (DMT)-like permease
VTERTGVHGRTLAIGLLGAMLGAVGFATKGIFAKKLYEHGWTFDAVQVARMWLALPVFWLWGWWRVGAPLLRPDRTALLGAVVAGLICYHFGAMLNFYALTMIDASLERVLLFTYPSMVVIAHSAIYRRAPDTRVVLALGATFLGVVAAVSGLDLDIFRANMHGALLVLLCAASTTAYFLASDRWTPRVGSITFTVWAMSAASLGLAMHALLVPSARPPMPGRDDLWLLAGLVGIATVFAMLMTAEGVRRLGAQRAAVVSTVGPPATILFAVPLLGERLNLVQWLGVVLIIAGILVMELTRTGAFASRGQAAPGDP